MLNQIVSATSILIWKKVNKHCYFEPGPKLICFTLNIIPVDYRMVTVSQRSKEVNSSFIPSNTYICQYKNIIFTSRGVSR